MTVGSAAVTGAVTMASRSRNVPGSAHGCPAGFPVFLARYFGPFLFFSCGCMCQFLRYFRHGADVFPEQCIRIRLIKLTFSLLNRFLFYKRKVNIDNSQKLIHIMPRI